MRLAAGLTFAERARLAHCVERWAVCKLEGARSGERGRRDRRVPGRQAWWLTGALGEERRSGGDRRGE